MQTGGRTAGLISVPQGGTLFFCENGGLPLIHLILYNQEGTEMSRKIIALLLVVLMAFGMTGAMAEDAAVTVTDMHDRVVTLSEPATRVVALTPSDCEIL